MEDYIATLISGVSAILFIGLGLPLANEKIPPNRWYGYRVSRYQFEDNDIWYAVNMRGGRHLVLAGVGCLAYTAISALFIGRPGAQIALLLALSLMLMAFIVYEISWSVRLARQMARDRDLIENKPGAS